MDSMREKKIMEFCFIHRLEIESLEKYLIIDKRCITHTGTFNAAPSLSFFLLSSRPRHVTQIDCVTDRVRRRRRKKRRIYCSLIYHSPKLILSHRVEVNRLSSSSCTGTKKEEKVCIHRSLNKVVCRRKKAQNAVVSSNLMYPEKKKKEEKKKKNNERKS